jgi:Protein of unknown function (DUF3040)
MNDEQVSRAIDEIERALRHDDPAFVQRVRALRRAEIGTVVTVALLLVSGAVLLTVGLATLSWAAWGGGLLALLVSVVVDEHHKHALRRMS